MSQRIRRFTAVLEAFIQFPDVDKWELGGYSFDSHQDSDGYYGYVYYRRNNVARIALPPPGVQGQRVLLVRSCGWTTPSTSRTIGAALRAVQHDVPPENRLHVNIKKGVLTLSDGRIVPDQSWLTV